ncbi:hypothetical protein F2Q69_00021289 [Brassica cretica]|uniref:Replication factor A C-terminal domain-containing protein n=1 Tax=Brassica cretica TaxID=69181 RepID=A0A8S9QFQ0_BRACR|nr:hypothetical protein F2Q69_00021289 [Brassica cretica]
MFTCGTRLRSSTANSATPANTKHIRDLSYLFYIPLVNPPFKPTGNFALSYIDKHVGSDVAVIANASEVTKVSLMMLRLERDSNWYYIACSDCQTKVNRGPTSLICPKCRNVKVTGVAKYCTDLPSTTMTIRPLLCYL